MAKRKKTADRIGKTPSSKPKPSRHDEPKAKSQQEDSDSDAGSFMDDDTEDFLPTMWTGKTKKSTKDGRISLSEVEEEGESEDSSTSAGEVSIVDSVITSVAAMSIKAAAPAPVAKSAKSQFVQPSDDVEPIKSKTTLLSRLEVPSSFLLKPRSALEDLRAQVTSLKHQLEKKEKDLKASKQQIVAAKSELATFQKKNENIISRANTMSVEKSKLEYKCLQLQATIDKHTEVIECLETEHNEELKTQRKQAKKELRLEVAKTKKALSEVQQMTSEEKNQQSMITQLRKELADKTTGQRLLQTALQQAQEEELASRNRFAAMNFELADLKNELVGERELRNNEPSFEEQDLRRRYADMSNQLNQIKQNNTRSGDTIRKLKKENTGLRNELYIVQEDLRITEESENELRGYLSDKDFRIQDLEKEIEEQQPLVEVGAAIRLRFLEQARESVFDLDKSDVDKCLIQDGNIETHRANGDKDAALFKLNLGPEENYDDMEEIFKELYETSPFAYPCCTKKMSRLTDCEATLKTLKGVSDSKAANKRKEHGELSRRLINMHYVMSNHDFESSIGVRDLLEELEGLTDKIVNMDRPKYGRR
ncbi:uncharacterized protein PAC_04681 [Phialocephala subalpina]|uniref:Uncharacterized protein n=1 Tax=Phialocephala subalpina TaxID=576137 RepID=A0A1L7WPV4_9HELO|nr:uncharacterized protein PAC_04681 [Phialocephala subalpina]